MKVTCDTHGQCAGYIVCRHIVDHSARVAVVDAPDVSNEFVGAILCEKGERHSVPELVLVCETCAKARGWVK